MKFTCEKSVLLGILSNLSRSVAIRSSVPSLEGIHVVVDSGRANFESFNLEFGLQTFLEVSDSENGEIVVPSKIFLDIVKKMPDALISVSSEDLNLKIKCLDSEFSLPCIDPKDFPNLPKIEEEQPISMNSEIMKGMIKQTIFSVSSDAEQNIHSGELIEVENGILTIAAVDGFRMAVRKERVDIENNFKIVAPGKALSEILRLVSPDSETLTMYISERYIFFKFDDYTFLSRLLDGNFIDYKGAIPSGYETRVRVNVEEMIKSIERVSVVVDDRLQSPVRGTFKDDTIFLSCATQIGVSNDKFDSKIEGKPIEIAFNDRYMIEALKNCEGDEVIIEMVSPLKPIKILPIEGEGFTFLVLPVRLK